MSRVRVPFPARGNLKWLPWSRESGIWKIHFLYEMPRRPQIPPGGGVFYCGKECGVGVSAYSAYAQSSLHPVRAQHSRRVESSIEFRTRTAPYPSGKGEVCKTFMRRFESARRLNTNVEYGSRNADCNLNLGAGCSPVHNPHPELHTVLPGWRNW